MHKLTFGFAAALAVAGLFGVRADDTAVYGLETCRLVEPYNVVKPVFSWKMRSDRKGAAQVAYRLTVIDPEARKPVWTTGEIASDASFGIRYAGPALASGKRYDWTVEAKDEKGAWLKGFSFFETGLLERDEWKKAKFVCVAGAPAGAADAMSLMKVVRNAKAVRKVYWFTTGLGVYDAYANGANITHFEPSGEDKEFLKPGFTHYAKCRQYFGYDITHQVKRGAGEKNVYAAWVTHGWWSDQPNGKRGKKDAFAGVMIYRYEDGTEERFYTDRSWLGAYGKSAITTAGIFYGQSEDARIDVSWMKSGDTAGFSPVEINTEFKGEIRPLQGSPSRLRFDREQRPVYAYVYRDVEGANDEQFGRVKKLRVFKSPVGEKLAKGETMIVDFGQNLAGKPNFTFAAAAGTEISVNVAEMLNDDWGKKSRKCDGPEGSLYRKNYRAARTQLDFICAGKGDELAHAKYSFFGFRYISIRATADVEIRDCFALPISSVTPSMEIGRITTSDASLNQLISNGWWGMYSNYLSVPTDCPQRDERLGWAADTQVFTKTGCYYADVYGFLSKWMADMRDSQHATGGFPGVAPLAQYGDNDAALGWADAGVIVPHTLWQMFGDTTVLEENWAAMERYLAFVIAHNGPNPEPWGEWLAYERNDRQIKEYLAAAFGVWDAMMMQDMAKALGKADAVAKYAAFEKTQRAYFASKFLDEKGEIRGDYAGQAACIYALWLDLVKGEAFKATAAALKKNIMDHGGKLQTGFLGTALIQRALVKAGMPDVAYTLLLQRGNPSWLYSVDQGATTFWERWNSYTKDGGFGDAGMNSFNHYAYGAVIAWMFDSMAGIHEDPKAPGFRHFVLRPHPDKRVNAVSAEYDSASGLITSAWKYGSDGKVTWNFTIPANTSATVVTPDGRSAEYVSGSYSLVF